MTHRVDECDTSSDEYDTSSDEYDTSDKSIENAKASEMVISRSVIFSPRRKLPKTEGLPELYHQKPREKFCWCLMATMSIAVEATLKSMTYSVEKKLRNCCVLITTRISKLTSYENLKTCMLRSPGLVKRTERPL
ncbi:hypothetical protein OS493_036722 [Desmophyllum pertusum]|uniref:Uncharacterized protein n=1 Tax=Desmophyllum pertusum TaxID=174260 RepID=A0A9W9Z8U2_9CNID|nr:hypothetical protein OS493_036722 [Desmophyllum pertusum]